MIAVKCVGITLQGKKSTFIVVDIDIIDATIRANNLKFPNTNLNRFESLVSIEVIGDTDKNTLAIREEVRYIKNKEAAKAVNTLKINPRLILRQEIETEIINILKQSNSDIKQITEKILFKYSDKIKSTTIRGIISDLYTKNKIRRENFNFISKSNTKNLKYIYSTI